MSRRGRARWPTHRGKRGGRRPPRDLEPEPPTPDDLARSLVRRGLASAQIIGPSEPTPNQAPNH